MGLFIRLYHLGEPEDFRKNKDLTVILNHSSNFIGPQSVLSLEETLYVRPADSSGSDLSLTMFWACSQVSCCQEQADREVKLLSRKVLEIY